MKTETVRIFFMTGGVVDIKCAGMQEAGSYMLFQGPHPEEKALEPETWAKFQKAAIAGYLVLDTQGGGR